MICRTKRISKRLKYLDDYVISDDMHFPNCTIDLCYRMRDVPRSYRDAISCNKKLSWKTRCLRWNIRIRLTMTSWSQGGGWVYAVNLVPSNEEKLKARYVAKEYLHVENVDCQVTFSPIARLTFTRLLMELSVQNEF